MRVIRRASGTTTPTASPDIFPSPTIDFTTTGTTDILTVPAGRIFWVVFCMDVTGVITGGGVAHSYKIKTDSAVDIIPSDLSLSNALLNFSRREAADNIALAAGEKVQVEITVASTFTTHTGKFYIHGFQVAL